MKIIFKLFSDLNRYLLAFEKVFMCILLFTMILFSFGQVVARNVFSSGFIWVDPILRMEVLWITFIGASLATEYKQHIKIDFLVNVIYSAHLKRIINTAAQVFALAVCILLFFTAASYIKIVSPDTASTIIHRIPDWILKLVIPYCFFVMVLRCIIHIMRNYFGGEPDFQEFDSVSSG